MSVDALKWVGRCQLRGAGPSARSVAEVIAWKAAERGDANAARAHPPVEIPAGHAACWAGVTEIARVAGAGTATVRRVLSRLEQAGVLTRRRRYRHVHGRTSRVEDVILLDLRAPAVDVPLSGDLSDKRAEAGRAGAAARRHASGPVDNRGADRAGRAGEAPGRRGVSDRFAGASAIKLHRRSYRQGTHIQRHILLT